MQVGIPVSVLKPWLVVAVLALLVMVTALSVVYSAFHARLLVAEFQAQQERRDALHVERAQLLLEQSTWGSFNRVEQLAIEELNMHVPEPGQIVMVK